MHLILLPAFDGTGLMFKSFLQELGNAFNAIVIPYPETGSQDYATLSDYVRSKIPEHEDYIVLGESFAGPIVYDIANKDEKFCKGAVFVATYLTDPSPKVLKKLTSLPASVISFLISRPTVISKLTLSKAADFEVAKAIAKNFSTVNADIIKQRLKTINSLGDVPPASQLSMPCLNLSATKDKLVMKDKIQEFQNLCSSLDLESSSGGHFILQENPGDSAKIVKEKFA